MKVLESRAELDEALLKKLAQCRWIGTKPERQSMEAHAGKLGLQPGALAAAGSILSMSNFHERLGHV